MSEQSQDEIRRAQNRSKRAIAEDIANEVGALNQSLNKLADSINEVCAQIAPHWEGAAAEAFLSTVRAMADELSDLGAQTKTVCTAIKSAAMSAYPDQ